MIVRFVAHSDFLFSDLEPQLSICLLSSRSLGQYRVVLEDFTHVVEQSRDRQHHCGRPQAVPAVQTELSVLVALGDGL